MQFISKCKKKVQRQRRSLSNGRAPASRSEWVKRDCHRFDQHHQHHALANFYLTQALLFSFHFVFHQEALLDIGLRFSDGSWVKLDEIERENYVLAVGSLEPTVVELPPIQNSKYPRIIAVSEGSGPIMR